MVAGISAVLGQAGAVPAEWIGTWTLSLPESKTGPIWGPGAPESSLTVISQTLKIAAAAGHMKITDDTVIAGRGPSHGESDLDISRKETVIPGGATVSFKRFDDTAFDVILSVNNKQLGNHVGENHFVFSGDGNTLTETKTHTEREVVPEGIDQTKGAVIRTSTSVLVFHKNLD